MSSRRKADGEVLRARASREKGAPLSAIRRWARQIAAQFHPHRIVLFGSHAYGRPRTDSDVDVLVVMPAANEISQSIRLTLAFEPPFPLDLIVRTPEHVRRGLEDGDSFLREIITKGKVLYAQADGPMGTQGGGRRRRRKRAGSAQTGAQ